MFVKLVRKSKEKNAYVGVIHFFECMRAKISYVIEKGQRVAFLNLNENLLGVTPVSYRIEIDDSGNADHDVYYLNNDGKTIEKVL